MSVVKCKNCGKEIDKKASICIHCGVKTHPIKDILKIVVIVLGVLISLILILFILSGGLSSTIKEMNTRYKYKKYFGNYELVGNIDDYKDNYTGVVYQSEDITLEHTYNIKDIYTTLEFKTEKSDKFSYVNDGLKDNEIIYNTKYNYIVAKIALFNIYDEKNKTYACFKLDKEYLKQVNCKSSNNDLVYIENIGLKYKKNK